MSAIRKMLSILTLVAAFSVRPESTLGCDYCIRLENALTVSHPKSIQIAVATKKAIDKGILKQNILIPSENINAGTRRIPLYRLSAKHLVQNWSNRLAPKNKTTQCVHFLFIDTRETCELLLFPGRAIYSSVLTEPNDVLIVTTRNTFHAIANEKLKFQRAVEQGLAVLESEQEFSITDSFFVSQKKEKSISNRIINVSIK